MFGPFVFSLLSASLKLKPAKRVSTVSIQGKEVNGEASIGASSFIHAIKLTTWLSQRTDQTGNSEETVYTESKGLLFVL